MIDLKIRRKKNECKFLNEFKPNLFAERKERNNIDTKGIDALQMENRTIFEIITMNVNIFNGLTIDSH